MRVKIEESTHACKGIIFENASKAEWSKEISNELILIKDSILVEWIPKPLRVTLNRPMPNLWTESHEKGGTRKEILYETSSYSKGIAEWIASLLSFLLSPGLLLLPDLLLSLFLFLLL